MKQTETSSDNHNPRASVGILCPYMLFFFVFESVYKNLENVEFILDFTALPRGFVYPEWYKKRMRTFFKQQNVYFRDFEKSGLAPEEFFSKYHTLVGGFFGGLIAHLCNRTKKKVRILYGLAKDLNTFTLENTHFDLVLCPSEYIAKKIKDLYGISVAVVGDPKYDRYILNATEQSVSNKIVTDQSKKNILFAPTWGNLSSEEEILPILSVISQKYNVFYKPHHMTVISQPELVQNYSSSNITVIEDTVGFMDLLKEVDVVIMDNSSAIFDTIIVKKPIVLIDNTVGNVFPHKRGSFFSFQKEGFGGVSTSLSSLEQMIKKEGQEIAPIVRLSSNKGDDSLSLALESAIESANNPIFLERQKKITDTFSGVIDGKTGERAAFAIRNMIEQYPENTRSELEQYVYDYENKVREEMRGTVDLLRSTSLSEEEILNIRQLPMTEKVKRIIDLFY